MASSPRKRPDLPVLAFLGEVMDSAGYLSIKKVRFRVGAPNGGRNFMYSERIGIKKVAPELPMLLRDTFGGHVWIEKPGRRRRKPLYRFEMTDLKAAGIIKALVPYLQVKRQQALVLAKLRRWKENTAAHQFAWWWVKQHRQWRRMPMLMAPEVAKRLGYRNERSVSQALQDGILVALPTVIHGYRVRRRFPEPLIREIEKLVRESRVGALVADPPPLMARYEGLYREVRRLNAAGRGYVNRH